MIHSFHLEPIDENDLLAGYRGVVDLRGLIGREELAQRWLQLHPEDTVIMRDGSTRTA